MNGRTPSWRSIAALAVAALIALWAATYFVRAWAQGQIAAETERKVVQADAAPAADARVQQELLSSGYRWIDAERGVVGLPIERAMELVVREQGGQP